MCATPRSGSTLLCEMLRATGRAGRPSEHFEVLRHSGLPRQPREYLEGVADARVLDLLAPLEAGRPRAEAPAAWRARIRRAGRTPNGVWGGKLMWGHVEDLLARARAGTGLATALGALLGGDVRFVLVTRRDTVAQAVSLWRAVQTQRWRADARPPLPPRDAVYSFAAIDHLVAQLDADAAAWRAWFARERIAPLALTYEELVAAPRTAVERVLALCGQAGAAVGAPPLREQRDERSRAWAARYLAEKRGAAAA